MEKSIENYLKVVSKNFVIVKYNLQSMIHVERFVKISYKVHLTMYLSYKGLVKSNQWRLQLEGSTVADRTNCSKACTL